MDESGSREAAESIADDIGRVEFAGKLIDRPRPLRIVFQQQFEDHRAQLLLATTSQTLHFETTSKQFFRALLKQCKKTEDHFYEVLKRKKRRGAHALR
jgi:hypothetical protein